MHNKENNSASSSRSFSIYCEWNQLGPHSCQGQESAAAPLFNSNQRNLWALAVWPPRDPCQHRTTAAKGCGGKNPVGASTGVKSTPWVQQVRVPKLTAEDLQEERCLPRTAQRIVELTGQEDEQRTIDILDASNEGFVVPSEEAQGWNWKSIDSWTRKKPCISFIPNHV